MEKKIRREIWILGDHGENVTTMKKMFDSKYRTEYFSTVDAYKKFRNNCNHRPSLIIATSHTKGGTFIELLRRYPFKAYNIPFIMLFNNCELDDLRFCYEKGAIHCMCDPMVGIELLAKVENLFHEITLDLSNPKVHDIAYRISKKYFLTLKETKIITLFLAAPNYIMSRDSIMDALWKGVAVTHKTLDVHLYNLRKKLTKSKVCVESLGVGEWKLINVDDELADSMDD